MTRTLHVEPEAELELGEAVRWYEARSPGLGAGLVAAVGDALARVLEEPGAFPMVAALGLPRVRRTLVARFPYAIIFVESPDRVDVIAVAHGRREPLYWAERVRR